MVGPVTKTFKVDTGVDGNLMPIKCFQNYSQKVSLKALGKTVEKGVALFAYNNVPIRQFCTCSIRLSFKGNSGICRFFVVEHETAIVGITDSKN